MQNADSPKGAQAGIHEAARDWFVRRLGTLGPAEQAEFEAWRRAHPAHDEAFRKVEAVWQSTQAPGQRVAEQEADKLAVYLKAMDRAKRQRKAFRRLTATCLVLLAATAAAVWFQHPHLLQNMTADYATGRGERRALTLSDGTAVLLDADSALDQRFGQSARRVRLLRGTAFFDIAQGAAPFIVEAANGEIRDIGTRFEVGIVDDGGVVTLESGKVAVTIDSQPGQTILDPGQRVHFGQVGMGPIEAVDLDAATAWRSGRYIFYRTRLSDVVAQIARYRSGRIVIASPGLGDQIVSGSFALTDTDAALDALQASVGFRMTRLGPLTVLSP